jgi:ribose transport system ATP-binding protein
MNAVGYDDIVRAMVGRPLELFARDIHGDHARGPAASDGTLPSSAVPRLAVRNLCSAGRFDDISFDIRAGEIVGLAGLMGAGRTEIARALFGRDRYDAGAVEVDGRSRRVTSPRHAMNAGIIMVPEERKSQGLVLDRSVRDNLTIADADRVSRFGWLSRSKARAVADDLVRRLGIKAPSADTAVVTLSGGNQQKVVIGRCFLRDYSVYIFDEPTRGVDVNAKTQIYHLINELTERGAGVLLISSELPEVIAVADRVLVMKDGRITADIPSAEATEEAILSAAMA